MEKIDQRIAIGRACGWEPCEPKQMPGSKGFWATVTHAFRKNGAYYGGLNALPRYEEDLNAMHEAECRCIPQDPFELTRYEDILIDIINRDKSDCTRGAFRAPAAQRAEALLKYLDRWVESPQQTNGIHN